MQQHINLYTLGYSILANFSERDIERDITLNENSVWLQIFGTDNNACELMRQQKFAYNVKIIKFMRILSGAANSVNGIYFMTNNRNLLAIRVILIIANLPVQTTEWWPCTQYL